MATKQAVLKHAEYLTWAMRAVSSANRQWRASHPDQLGPLMTRDGLHFWLYSRGVEDGWIPALPEGRLRKYPISYDVALAFQREPWTVKEVARDYWRQLKANAQ